MTRRRFTLARFVAATLVGVTTLLLVVLGVIGYRAEARARRNDLSGLAKVQADQLAVALATPAWNIDRPEIAKVVDAMSQPKSIYAISVTAAGETVGRVRDPEWRVVPWKGGTVPSGMMVETRPIVYAGNSIGTVRLYVTPRFTQEELRALARRFVIAIVLIDLLIIASVYFVLWRAVLRPVTEIERYAGAVSAGDQQRIAPIGGAAAELENLRASIESMVDLLALREARFRSIFESVNDAIFIIDRDTGAILDVNPRVSEMFGYTREEVTSMDVGVLSAGLAPYTLPGALARIRDLEPGAPQMFEWRARHKDGRLFWAEVSLRAAVLGGVVRVVSVVRDIDERRAMEEALRHSETMSAMGSLVAGVAHEVRNPLFGIAAALDAFEAEFGSGAAFGEYLATLRKDTARLTRLMHELLEYGRPRRLDRHEQSIEPVIAEAIRVCAPAARQKQIEIRADVMPDLPHVSIDADRIVQVLKNVTENAIEFSPAGGTVTLRAARDGDGAIVCSVADDGPGFREGDLPRVFEPFFTRRAGGSGLGLAIVQKIVADHGGSIIARNADDGGGVVEVRLP